MKAKELHELAFAKIEDLGIKVENKSVNKNPDYYKTKREYDLWTIIDYLVNSFSDDGDIIDGSMATTFRECAQIGAKRTIIAVHEGDNAMEILCKNPSITYDKLQKAADAAGLVITNGVFVRK